MNGIKNPSHRANRVPQSQKIWCAGNAESIFETGGNLEFAGIVALVKSQGIRYQRLIPWREQSTHLQKSAERTSSVSATTEAEDEDLGVGFELFHQERIDVRDVVGKAIAEGQAPHSSPPLSQRAEGISRPHRADARVIVGDLLFLCWQRPVEFYNIRICIPILVPGSVTTNNDVFRHIRSTSRTQGTESL